MPKTLYSLLLSASVVEEIDKIAAQEGYSRSALINHILAEYAGMQTPRGRNRNVTQQLQRLAVDAGFRTDNTPGGMLHLFSTLRYKYNPCVRYCVELYEDKQPGGRLTVGVRTQNEDLSGKLAEFFEMWIQAEQQNSPSGSITGGRFVRPLLLKNQPDDDAMAQAIAGFVSAFDTALRAYLEPPRQQADPLAQTEKLLRQLWQSDAWHDL